MFASKMQSSGYKLPYSIPLEKVAVRPDAVLAGDGPTTRSVRVDLGPRRPGLEARKRLQPLAMKLPNGNIVLKLLLSAKVQVV